MKYRVVSAAQSHEIAAHLVAGHAYGIDAVAAIRGEGQEIDYASLEVLCSAFEEEVEEDPLDDVDLIEGRFAVLAYPWFSSIQIEILDDPGFWRYISLKYFWWFISVREATPISNGNVNSLVDAALPAEQIPLRMFLRAKAVDVDGDASLAGQLSHSADFWRSHVKRVRLGSAPAVSRKFAEAKLNDAGKLLTTNPLRRVARQLNRTWANTNLDLYSEDDAQMLIEEFVRNTAKLDKQ